MLSLCSYLLLGFWSKEAHSQPVPVGDRVYDLIDQASMRKLLPAVPIDTRPYDRKTISSLLIHLTNEERIENRLPAAYRYELRRYIEQYKREITEQVGEEWWKEALPYEARLRRLARQFNILPRYETICQNDGRVLEVTYENGAWFSLDPIYDFRYDHSLEQQDIFRRGWGVVLETGPLPWLTAMVRWQDRAEWGNEPYGVWNDRSKIFDDRIGFVNPTNSEVLAYEDLLAGLQVTTGRLSFFYGRDRLRWGPGRTGNLVFSGETTSFTQCRISLRLSSNILFSSLVGSLAPFPEKKDTLYTAPTKWIRTIRSDKYISAHRLEFALSRSIQIGLHETVIFAERGLDMNYLNPLTIYFSEEHESGDQDNAMMGFDARLIPIRDVSLWTELLIDDLQFGKLGTNYYSNKIGWLAGGAVAGSGSRALPVESGVEYAKLRPYVYSHFYPINSYKHWNAPLGLQMQPNSDRFSTWFTWMPYHSLRFGFEGFYLRHGANRLEDGKVKINVGGDYDHGWFKDSVKEAPFLDGDRQDRSQAQLWLEWETIEGLILSCMAGIARDYDEEKTGAILAMGITWNHPVDRRWTLRGR